MHGSFSRFPIASVVSLALLGLAWTAAVAQAADSKFQASGEFQVVASNGSHFFFEGEGQAGPGGRFTTTVEAHDNFGNLHETGVQTLDFGNGDTLTISFEDDWVPDTAYPFGGYRVGPYVVVAGTGRLAGASGSGTLTGIPNGDGTGKFDLNGTISR
jgi:hypothetical protein